MATPATAMRCPEAVPESSAGGVAVCLTAMNFYPVYAGPAIRFNRYLPAFASHGVSVRVFTGTPEIVKARASGVERDWGDWNHGQALPVADVNGVPLYRTRLPDAGKRRRALMLARALVDHCRPPERRPDVIQLLACSFDWIPSLLRLRRFRIPLVYTATMLGDLRRANPLKRELLRRYIALPMQLVDAVVVSSDVMRESLQGLGVRRAVHVIPNGVDTERFRSLDNGVDRRRIRKELGIPDGDPMALFVGPIVARKGIDLLLEAWSRLCRRWPRLHLVLAGPRLDVTHPANGAFHEELNRLVEASGAPERIHFTGMVENVEEYMRAADIFVFPSRREGMPNVVPEAMASGLPVVMTPFIGLPREFGEAGHHYVLVDFDAGSLAEGIGKLLEKPELRTAVGASGRAWVEKHLAVEASVQTYVDLYRNLAHSGHARSRYI